MSKGRIVFVIREVRRLRRPAGLAFASLSLLLLCCSSSLAGEIRGRVLIDGRPVGGVEVGVVPFEDGFARARCEARREEEPRPLATATTSREGRFAVSVPPAAASAAALRLFLTGGSTAPVVLTRLLDGAHEDVGDAHLSRTAVVAGRVLDPRGGPVVGATVTLWAGESRRFDDVSGSPIEKMVTLSGDTRVDLEAPPARLAGIVVDFRKPVVLSATWRCGS